MTDAIMCTMLLVGMTVTGGIVIAILLNHYENAYRDFAVLGLFCSMLILLSYYVELQTADFSAKISAAQFGYVGKVFVNPMLVMLVMRYYGVRLGKIIQILLYVIPILTLNFVFYCRTDHTYYSSITFTADGVMLTTPGPFYYIYMSYNILLALIYMGFCLYQRAGLQGRDRTNNTLLLSACLVPLASMLVYLSGVTGHYDVTCIGVMGGAILLALSIFRFGLLNKEEMLQSMTTGLVFLDGENRLIYANHAAMQMFPALGMRTVRLHQQELSQLLSEQFASVQIGKTTYQRRISGWTNGSGQRGKLLTFEDITEIRARLNRDAMTGLLNHASFYPMLEQAMADAAENGTALSVSIADIDSFKRINDTYGHANGDVILIALADTLTEICADTGNIFRYGGEEFAVIFRCNHAAAEQIMQKALKQFSAKKFDFLPYSVTFSFGSAEYNGTESAVALFERTDQIMYTRKKALHAREQAEAAANGTAIPSDTRLE